MTTQDWHVDDELWARYADRSLDAVAASSVDAHVVRCSDCQLRARDWEPTAAVDVWPAVRREVSRPRLPAPLRLARRLGLPDGDAVVIAASDSLYLPWVMAVGGALVCAMLTGISVREQDIVFVLLAPLVPVLSVVAAYDATDPLRELTAGTAFSKLRVALLRTSAALLVAVPLTLAVSLSIPGLEDLAFVWLLPGLFLTLCALVLMTWWRCWVAAALTALVWLTVVFGFDGADSVLSVGSVPAQSVFAALCIGAVAVLVRRESTPRSLGGAR